MNSQDKSQKPKSPRALNAYRHGLTGQIHLMTAADQKAYEKHCHDIMKSLAPRGGMETELAQAICDDRWRLKSAAAWEKAILAEGITQLDNGSSGHEEVDAALAHGRVWVKRGKDLALLSLYEHRMQRRVEKNLQLLKELQAGRTSAEEHISSDVERFLEAAKTEGRPYDPEKEYPADALYPQFDFSIPDIVRKIHHRQRYWEVASRKAKAASA